ncbi:fumarylacetoacetate hydrolase family protein [Xinfangfangia sp. D13-10-4-6]|uniref:fumarylacetoacetate hydrolase family protein n=1 Tax=Pseudogemmobacter hezensis TaxID=2737662 RepID=UPI0015560EC2|nr:fumarylacetoacetate hydrolase family protein [Pseudogemmobacter hezensis]NPD14091.1 fumarylacetoacetate hydrolase family protein [Pseudogemmobacter hezensis]
MTESDSPRYVITPPPQAALPVQGSDRLFPVNRVFCIGRNYAAHAVEMGHDPDREPPFFFLKSADCVTADGTFPYPPGSQDVQHEVELVVALGLGGRDIPVEAALSHVWGYGIGLDMTRRDLQAEAKKLGRPWEIGKNFAHSAPCGPLSPASEIGHPAAGAITLDVNGQRRQSGDLNQMIWKIPEVIATLSRWFQLQPGDIIMTGTPAGVGAVSPGDLIQARIAGFAALDIRVT